MDTSSCLKALRAVFCSALLLTSVGVGAANSETALSTPSAFSNGAKSPSNKWHPGIYVKVENWQRDQPAEMKAIFKELKETPQLRGIKVVMRWGKYETRDPQTGISTFDFSEIDELLDKLAQLDNKHLILAFSWREFKGSNGASNVLPDDLRGGTLWNDTPQLAHVKYDYLWAYRTHQKLVDAKAPVSPYAYNLKLWDKRLMARIEAFLAALAAHVDSHPNFNQISTTESSIGEPLIPFGAGESAALQYEGQLKIIRLMRKYFVQSLVVPDLNFSREYVASVIPLLAAENIGLGSSNSNKGESINRAARGAQAPGVLTYYPQLSNKVPLVPEIQGEEYRASYGSGSKEGKEKNGKPSYEALYLRVRDELKANYTVMQRNTPYWLGDAKTPSMLKFIQTYPAIVNDPTGAGGLNATLPVSMAVKK